MQQQDAEPFAYTLHTTTILCLAAAVPLVRWILHVSVLKPLASYMLLASQRTCENSKTEQLQPKAEECSAQISARKVEKLAESLWKFLVYGLFTCLGLASILNERWLLDTKQYWEGWPDHDFTPTAKALYHLELAFYISSCFMICLWETPRKDFAVMLSHHVITAALLATSLYCKFWRVGCVVMVLHDANDVFMEAAKAAQYCKLEDAAVAIFAVFFVSWAATRLCALPLMVMRSTLLELPHLLGGRPPMYYAFNGALLVLLALHCYWFMLMLRIIYVKVVTGENQDIREDDDD